MRAWVPTIISTEPSAIAAKAERLTAAFIPDVKSAIESSGNKVLKLS